MKRIVFYGYSPKHMELLYSLLNVLPSTRIILVGPEDFVVSTIARYSGIFEFDSLVLPRQTSDVGFVKKLLARLQTFLLLKDVNPDLLVTSNELAPASIIMSKKKECKEIIVLDEGDFDVILSKESVLNRYKTASKVKKFLFGFTGRFQDPRVMGVVTESSFAKQMMADKIIPVIYKGYIGKIRLGSNSVIVITSPLSENKNSKYHGQEIDILTDLIKRNKEFDFYIRTHYRERDGKYQSLIKYSNCSYLEEYSEAPISDLKIQATYAIGFHSSALSSPGLVVDKTLSLSGFVGSNHSRAVLETLSSKYALLDDFVLPQSSHDSSQD